MRGETVGLDDDTEEHVDARAAADRAAERLADELGRLVDAAPPEVHLRPVERGDADHRRHVDAARERVGLRVVRVGHVVLRGVAVVAAEVRVHAEVREHRRLELQVAGGPGGLGGEPGAGRRPRRRRRAGSR